MHNFKTLVAAVLVFGFSVFGIAVPAAAEGEPDGTFPNWEERWIHQLINRARCDPQFEMAACGSNCAEAACYSPLAPLPWKAELNRAGRFHSANMALEGFTSHTSACTIVSNIGALYPQTCDGSASCACVGGTSSCSPTCTSASSRVNLFGSSYGGEIIAWTGGGPNSAFYAWLYEHTNSATCTFTQENGHRWLILTKTGAVGIGQYGIYYTGDFGSGSAPAKIPSGSHYPRQAAAVEVWANWYDAAGPSAAAVNLAGTCHPMSLERGTATNGAWMVEATGLASGCHRYYFEFQDSVGTVVTYPTTGSLAIGSGGSCPPWDASRPDPCLGASDSIFADGFETGNTTRWSTTIP